MRTTNQKRIFLKGSCATLIPSALSAPSPFAAKVNQIFAFALAAAPNVLGASDVGPGAVEEGCTAVRGSSAIPARAPRTRKNREAVTGKA